MPIFQLNAWKEKGRLYQSAKKIVFKDFIIPRPAFENNANELLSQEINTPPLLSKF